jgi:four helix bundle suffix protein
MAEAHKIVLPHGGYKKLLVFRKSDVVYEGTVAFCRRFLPPRGDRTVDQMVQAARSCKQNIAEGSSASGTSKETELKLTNVARATLDELMEDYRDFLERNGFPLWDGEKTQKAREYARTRNDWSDWRELFDSRPAETLANLMLTICHQTSYLLARMLARQKEDFTKHGGVRERMHAARTAYRAEEFSKGLYSHLASARTPEELKGKTAALRQEIARMVRGIARGRGWGE